MNELQNTCDITFFVPCLNEEGNIVNTLDIIISAVSETNLAYEIIVIDDNSIDRTINKVEEYKNQHSQINITLIMNAFTKGLGTNYVDGSFIGRGKYYMLVNGDNVEPKETILTIIREIGNADMIIPYFGKNDTRSLDRVLISKLFTKIVNFLSRYNISYYNGPVLHLRYNVMRWSPDTHGFAYQAELITRILFEDGSYKEVLIENSNRNYGISNAFRVNNILSVMHSLLQILLRRIRLMFFGPSARWKRLNR